MLPASMLHALSSMVSDHSPLLLVGASAANSYRGFRFESFWPKLEGYQEAVQHAWEQPVSAYNPFLRLHIKLSRTAKVLRQWAKKKIENNKLLLCVARQLIAILDVVQEHRQLSASEVLLRRDLKARFLGLMAVEKLRARQHSRLVSIRASEANSKQFYLHANGRRRKNFIRHLPTPNGLLTTHDEKANCVFQLFNSRIGTQQSREVTVDQDLIGLRRIDLQHLEDEFTEEEVNAVIQEIAPVKHLVRMASLEVFTKRVGM